MKVTVNRLFKSTGVISVVEVNDKVFCVGMEPLNPIQAGTYPLIKYFSPAHKTNVPLVSNVQGHSGIEIHNGDVATDSKDCLLIAYNIVNKDMINQSNAARDDFYQLFFADVSNGIHSSITYNDLF